MAREVIEDGPFNLGVLEYGPTSRVGPDYFMRGSDPTWHTVQVGDTIHGLSRLYGMSVEDIYQLNRGTLDRAAALHGYTDSMAGAIIFPGTTIKV